MRERTCVVCGRRAPETDGFTVREGVSSGRRWRAFRCADKPACDARRHRQRKRR
jgi:hypothetical protein